MGFGIGGAVGSHAGGLANLLQTKEMKACPGCAASIDASARFCPACGQDTRPANPPEPGGGAIACGGCGRPCAAAAKFCPECGGSLTRQCGGCGLRIEGSPNFCPECGTRL